VSAECPSTTSGHDGSIRASGSKIVGGAGPRGHFRVVAVEIRDTIVAVARRHGVVVVRGGEEVTVAAVEDGRALQALGIVLADIVRRMTLFGLRIPT
jgi:hypothetical protein